jgi:hypothetical protein
LRKKEIEKSRNKERKKERRKKERKKHIDTFMSGGQFPISLSSFILFLCSFLLVATTVSYLIECLLPFSSYFMGNLLPGD